MSEMLKTRDEIEEKDKWALEDMFATDEAWEQACVKMQEYIPQLEAYQGKIAQSAEALLGFLKLEDEASMLYEGIMVYANQKMHQDMGVSKYQGYSAKAQTIGTVFEGALAFAEPEILEITAEELKSFYQQAPGLEHYRIMFDRILRQKPHTLTKAEEEILAKTGDIATAASDIYALFKNADLTFDPIMDGEGQEHQLTSGNYAKYIESKDRTLRANAFASTYRVFQEHKNCLAAMYQANVKKAKFYADVKKFPSSREMALDGSQIPVSVYDNLIQTVHDFLPDMYRYVELRKKALGVDELHMYDVYVPLTKDYEMEVSFDQAKEMVLKGLAPMGEEYLSHIKEGFDNRWIDVYENKNKRGGAYSWGAYGTHPYVLLNYQGKLGDVFTLAHEMGHALHSYYSDANQSITYAGYRIFVAEVASTCNESLLMQDLLKKCSDKKEKIFLLNYFIDQFKGTIFRQTMFAEFEKITHEMYAKGEALTAETLCKVYYDLNKLYFGDTMVSDPEIAYEWARIPHFYTEFYVYQYATGFSAAIALSKRILELGEEGVHDYMKFLTGGSAKEPLELLKLAGVDLTRPEPVADALTMFRGLVGELEELLAQ